MGIYALIVVAGGFFVAGGINFAGHDCPMDAVLPYRVRYVFYMPLLVRLEHDSIIGSDSFQICKTYSFIIAGKKLISRICRNSDHAQEKFDGRIKGCARHIVLRKIYFLAWA